MLWIVDVDLDIEVVLLIKYSAFIQYLRKTVNTVRPFIRLVGLKKLVILLGGRFCVILSVSLVTP